MELIFCRNCGDPDTLSNAYGRGLLLSSPGDWSLNHEASPISSQLIQEIEFQCPANKEQAFTNQLLQEEHQLIILEKVKEELLGLRPLPPRNLLESSSFDAYGCMAALATPPSTTLDMDLPALELLASGFDRHLQESIPGSFFLHQKVCACSPFEHLHKPCTKQNLIFKHPKLYFQKY